MAKSRVTRSDTDFWLIGQPISSLPTTQLPTMLQAINFFVYLHRIENKTIRDSSTATINEIEKIWLAARIPFIPSKSSIPKLEKLFTQYNNLLKRNINTN